MRMFRSFLLRLGLILSTTAVVCLLLMTATLAIQGLVDTARLTGMVLGALLAWLVANWIMVRKIDPELSLEVARIVLPSGILFANTLSFLLMLYLREMIPGNDGREHLILPFVGVGITVYLVVRCFDLKWLRPEEEIAYLQKIDRGRK